MRTEFRAVEAWVWNQHERETVEAWIGYVLLAETRDGPGGAVVHRAAFPLTAEDFEDVEDFVDVVALPHVQGEIEKLTPGSVALVEW